MTEIVNFEALLNDDQKLKEVGSEITMRALTAALEQKMGLVPSYAPNLRTINAGDPVPSDLITKVSLRPDGTAAKGWSDTGWTDIGIWERSTWDKEGDTSRHGLAAIKTLPILERTKLISKLTADEVNILKTMKYIN